MLTHIASKASNTLVLWSSEKRCVGAPVRHLPNRLQPNVFRSSSWNLEFCQTGFASVHQVFAPKVVAESSKGCNKCIFQSVMCLKKAHCLGSPELPASKIPNTLCSSRSSTMNKQSGGSAFRVERLSYPAVLNATVHSVAQIRNSTFPTRSPLTI